jgi:outer membrane protein assembly factor BamB
MLRTGLVITAFCGLTHAAAADNWPAWRGPEGTGQCKERDLPVKWSATEGVRWKTPLPERGNSSPIVWGDRIFLTQALEKEHKRTLMCFDRKDGKLLWQKAIAYKEKESTHETNPYCSASPVTDGERVIVSHGSAGVVCYDFQGNQLWHRDLGKCEHIWGNAASPVLYQDLVILNFGPGERTFLIAMDKKTGQDVWKVEEPGGKDGFKGRAEWIGSWTTPVIASIKGRDELIMTWPGVVKAYNPRTGELLWLCRGLERTKEPDRLVYTSPLVTPEVVVAMGGFGGSYLAVRPGGNGDVTDTHRLWREERAPQRIGSGVIVGAHVFILNEDGTVQCIELRTGKTLWRERTTGKSWGSMVHADGKIYVTNHEGETLVLAAKPELEVLSRNPLKEHGNASPAISDGEIFIRTDGHLWCLSNKK